jgi:hypothetical protein
MKLYEINAALEALVDPDTGELMDYDAFEALNLAREEKIEGMALWYKDMVAEAKAIKEEADSLTARRKALENRADRLKSYLDYQLGGEKFQTARCSLTYRKTSSLQVEDGEKLAQWCEDNGHEDCVRYKEPEISKSAVAALIKSGVSVPYASIQEGRSLGVK